MTLTDYKDQEKEDEEDLPALKTALTHQYNDLKTIEKGEDRLITATRNNTDKTKTNRRKIPENKNE